MTGAYCSPEDLIDLASIVINEDLTDDQAYLYILMAMDEIDTALVGYYSVPFAIRSDPITWETTDKIPPFTRTITKFLSASIAIQKLFIAKSGKNVSAYADTWRKIAMKYIEKLQEGSRNLIDTEGNVIPRLGPDNTSIGTTMSESEPAEYDYVMPEMNDDYPDESEVVDGGS